MSLSTRYINGLISLLQRRLLESPMQQQTDGQVLLFMHFMFLFLFFFLVFSLVCFAKLLFSTWFLYILINMAKTPQTTSLHCDNGVQTTSPRLRSSLRTCTRRLAVNFFFSIAHISKMWITSWSLDQSTTSIHAISSSKL